MDSSSLRGTTAVAAPPAPGTSVQTPFILTSSTPSATFSMVPSAAASAPGSLPPTEASGKASAEAGGLSPKTGVASAGDASDAVAPEASIVEGDAAAGMSADKVQAQAHNESHAMGDAPTPDQTATNGVAETFSAPDPQSLAASDGVTPAADRAATASLGGSLADGKPVKRGPGRPPKKKADEKDATDSIVQGSEGTAASLAEGPAGESAAEALPAKKPRGRPEETPCCTTNCTSPSANGCPSRPGCRGPCCRSKH